MNFMYLPDTGQNINADLITEAWLETTTDDNGNKSLAIPLTYQNVAEGLWNFTNRGTLTSDLVELRMNVLGQREVIKFGPAHLLFAIQEYTRQMAGSRLFSGYVIVPNGRFSPIPDPLEQPDVVDDDWFQKKRVHEKMRGMAIEAEVPLMDVTLELSGSKFRHPDVQKFANTPRGKRFGKKSLPSRKEVADFVEAQGIQPVRVKMFGLDFGQALGIMQHFEQYGMQNPYKTLEQAIRIFNAALPSGWKTEDRVESLKRFYPDLEAEAKKARMERVKGGKKKSATSPKRFGESIR